ncbi:MAG: L-2-amino-thiazoline-4-carboxylic acid hydrolase [Candidatus Latescibacterota bacterium]
MSAPDPEITHFQRREIQAPVAACLIRGFVAEMGLDKALEVASDAIQADAEKSGETMAAKYGGDSLRELGRIVREVWAADEAITIRVLEETEREFRFDVVCCRYAELYDRLDMKELGFCLSCRRDGAFARGFNPRIRMTRTQTIMEGAPFCDFRFILV